MKSWLPSLTLAAIPLLACGRDAAPTGDGLAIAVAPLELAGIDYACYDIAIAGAGGTVVALGDPAETRAEGDTETICSWQYGNGAGGDITYIAPCDADDGDGDGEATNTVTLWVDGLYADPDGDHDPDDDIDVGDWQDPCPTGCTLETTCRENADTAVDFNLTVMRNARQGFFDVAIDFQDVHCSAKLDCVDALLHDPATGARGPTVVLGFACTSGQDADGTAQPTFLYLDDVRIECTNPTATYHFDPTGGPGQVGGQVPGVFQAAFYRGREELPGLDKCYWNAAFGLDVETLADPGVLEGDCWLRARGTASEVELVGGATPPGTIYPIVTWEVQLTNSAGTLVCGENPLDGATSGVQTSYTDFDGTTLGCAMSCASGQLDCGEVSCSGSVPSIPGGVTVGQLGDQVTLTFQGEDYAFPIDPAYTLAGCCADDCCATEAP